MKILFVFYVPSGGVETLNRERAAALRPAGIACEFLYYSKRRNLLNHEDTNVYITNQDYEIQQILKNGRYDAIIITSDYSGMERFRRLGFKGKIILEIQGLGPKSTARAELKKAIPYVNQYCNGLLYPKTSHIGALFNEFFPSKPAFAFNNCFNHNAFSYKPLPQKNKPIIAWIGRLEDNKNWREFLKIGSGLLKRNLNIELYMFEDPSLSTEKERKDFNNMKHTLNLDRHLVLLQDVPHSQMQHYFSRIGDSGGFLCSTSKVEGAPYSLLEAMSCRCPILTTDSDGVRSSIIHNHTGMYYSIGNIDEALRQADLLMNNVQLRKQIIDNALIHLKTQFSHEQYRKHFCSMLQTLGVS
ncbi:glycosyltransferase family 4 protein [Rossellomorea oryzaecorticis]|uniref:Glycosyltransferase family 4 protein n=1 Tax=Rossellomorea oryzaecorticis TaxID=1396505 RepID=A0ABW8VLM7_9BACI|nr:glycosyltransferase family 4 protein [[Bacillus] enclensis]MBH9965395.1 glycosyltransferase family 4 protein [[Bacillus] enclensis]QWC24558.1 glycosyltransferase family 4 protein [Bacillus haikouensis]